MRIKTLLAVAVLGAMFVFLPALAKADTGTNTIAVTGTLTSMSGTSLPATLTVDVSSTTYTVNVTTATKILRKSSGPSGLSEMLLGDSLQVKGTIGSNATTIDANQIRDLSLQRNGGTLKGTITSLDCTAGTFGFKPDKRVAQTAYFTSKTKFMRGGIKIDCTKLQVGERAVLIGTTRPSLNRLYPDRVIVNMRSIEGTITSVVSEQGATSATTSLLASLMVTRKDGVAWTIRIDAATKLFLKNMKVATIGDFKVGDRVISHGVIAASKTLDALILRDLSRTKPPKSH